MNIIEIIGHVLVVLGLIFVAFGLIGIYRFKGFYQRLLSSSKIDTVGTITVIIGMILIHGFNVFSLRLLLIFGILLLLGPLSTHMV
ncbi:MAG: monovalent cation/H(+) antiporter subunit G, partial [Defluviitaleaceae bacterium]|nr:monovalent cation/H(+) antiporter subunit G [Defluviitaleaceae bacterium]